MLQTFINIIHVFVCLLLIGVVLLQQGKGGGMGAAFGGASTQVFGGRGAGNILTRATAIFAAIFMLTSVSLAYLSSSGDRALRAKVAQEASRRKDKGELKERSTPPPAADSTPSEGASTEEKPTETDTTPAEGVADGAATESTPAGDAAAAEGDKATENTPTEKESTPAKPAENAPAKPAENAPAKPAENGPAKPAENGPAKPAESAPATKPAENAPATKPAENAPTKPAENAPADKPAENAPANKPAENAPAGGDTQPTP